MNLQGSTTICNARRIALALLALLLQALVGTCALAQAPTLIVERLSGDVPDDAIADIVRGRYDDRFVAEKYAALRPARDHAVWYRVRPVSDWSERPPPLLSIFDPQGLSITAFLPPEYVGVRHSMYDRVDDGFTRHALTFALPYELDASAPIYLRVDPERAVPRRIEVRSAAEARIEDLAYARLDVLFPAIQSSTVLVMICFFLALRERMYAYFVGHVFFVVLYELYAFGVGFELAPFSLLAPLGIRCAWLTAAIAAVLLLEFSNQFLDLHRVAPRLARLLAAFRWPLAALAICSLLPPLSRGWWVEDVLAPLLLVTAPLLVAAAVLAWQHGGRRGGFYLCAWIPGLLFVIARVLQLTLQWPLPIWLEFALPGAFAYASIVLAFGLADHTLTIRPERDVAHRLAEHDALTGLLNRRAILARLRAAFLNARESDESLSVLFLDLDHFKQVNDTYGHRAGDQCLRAIVGPIASELRQGDALGRYGGEEFLVVLPGATASNAEVVAERIRARVQEMPVFVSGVRIGLTVSVGIAAADADTATPDDLIARADAALYRSKSAGRNLVSTHESTVPSELDEASPEA